MQPCREWSTKDNTAERFAWILGRWSAEVLQSILQMDSCRRSWVKKRNMYKCVSNSTNQKLKKPKQIKALKPWRKANRYLAGGEHCAQSKPLAAQREQVTTGKKLFCRSQHLLCQQKKKRVLTTGGGLPVQSGNPLKHASLCLRDEVNKPSSQPECVNHFKPTPYATTNLNGGKESSCPEVQQATSTSMCWCYLLTVDSVELTSSNCSSFRWLSFPHSQAMAWLCPQNQGWYFALPSRFQSSS